MPLIFTKIKKIMQQVILLVDYNNLPDTLGLYNNLMEHKMYYNEKTKRPYSGSNIDILEATGLKGGFLTFRQAVELGYKIPAKTKAIAKLIRPIEEFREQSDGSKKVEMSGRKFPVFHTSQLIKEGA